MARKNRIIFEGAIYHIYQRGNNREYIFENPKHKAFLLKQIKEYNQVYDFQLLAYAIMGNHYHLLIKTNKTPITDIMFSINNVLAKYLNRELNRTGHVFENRYNCKLVDNDAYLLWVLRYIHRNPVRAKLCSRVDEYKWSSHYFYKWGINTVVSTDFILRILSEDKPVAIKRYKRIIELREEKSQQEDFERIRDEFQLNDLKIHYKRMEYEEYKTAVCNVKPLKDILDCMDIEPAVKELLKRGSKKHSITVYKVQFIREAIKNKYTLKQIATFLNSSQPAISNMLAYYKYKSVSNSDI